MYFCHSYHSGEKGSVENLNGFLRQYFLRMHRRAITRRVMTGLKGMDLSKITERELKEVEIKLNQRLRLHRRVERLRSISPRKRFGYISPMTLFCNVVVPFD